MPFKPGQSGNPNGRPREDGRLRDLARQYTDKAVETLVAALDNEKTAVAAAQALLDRGWGRPAQAITGADGGAILTESRVAYDLSALNDSELAQMHMLAEKVNAVTSAN